MGYPEWLPGDRGERDEESLLNRDRVSFWEDGKVLELGDDGGGFTTM